jgi:hypothetical protein
MPLDDLIRTFSCLVDDELQAAQQGGLNRGLSV